MKTTTASSVRTHLPILAATAVFLGACAGAPAPEAPAPTADVSEAAATITAAEMDARIHALAHDSMRGRDTPSPELEQAADYLATQFRQMGLEPAGDDGTYIHRYDYEASGLDPVVVGVVGQPGPRYASDYFLLTGQQPQRVEAPAVYAGQAGEVGALPAEARGGVVIFDTRATDPDELFEQHLAAAFQPAMMSGASALVLILDPEFSRTLVGQIAEVLAGEQAPMPIVGITHSAGTELLAQAGAEPDALRAAGEPTVLDAAIEIEATPVTETHTPPNVVAMVPGSDPTLRDTYVVITAHYDHVGIGTPNEAGDSIYNGADDNASGTSALVEIAEAFAALPEAPRRSVVFLAVSGEEKGLLGSLAYVEEPTVPIESIVANINMDMIGRSSPDTIIGIGQEYSDLEGVLTSIQAAHPELGLEVIRDPAPERMYFFRSDQLAFVQQMIPAVFFTGSEHEDYHEPSDEPQKIDADKASRVARLAFHLAHRIAMDPQAPEWTEEGRRQVEQMLQQSPF